MWEVVYEGDRLTLFGTLTYDTNTDQASFDETLSMMASQSKDSITSKLNWDYIKDCSKLVGYAALGLLCGVSAYVCTKYMIRRLRENRLKADIEQLANFDSANQIPDAPPKVRSLPEGLSMEVIVDDHICTTCKRNRATILFIPCKHCYQCEECYKKTAQKMTCAKCN